MTIFHLASFEPERHFTIVAMGSGGVMPWFDLLMMRKQFLTLKRLAEKTAAAA